MWKATGLGMRPIRVQILFLPLIRCVTLSMKCATPLWTSVSSSIGWRSPPSCPRGTLVQPAFHSTKSHTWGVLLPRVDAIVQFTYIIWACSLLGHEWLLGGVETSDTMMVVTTGGLILECDGEVEKLIELLRTLITRLKHFEGGQSAKTK